MVKKWTEEDIADQSGRIAVVTGANSGIGWETARALARRGATVIMACRDTEKASVAAERIKELSPAGTVIAMHLDLADLQSVRSFASLFRESCGRLDLLINNAGLGELPYGKTAQGFELHFGVNHLGHFALVGLLLDLLDSCELSRIVTVSSIGHRIGSIHFEDLNWERSYPPQLPYSQSKLANLLFTYELQRRLAAAGRRTLAIAAHPGWSDTRMMQNSFYRILGQVFAQPPAMGALPSLYAATSPEARGGDYIGPNGFMEFRGYPQKARSSRESRDEAVARNLWAVSEELTGVEYAIGLRPSSP
jgi:NAD(P)-dependent dehydrogenase (short-subunit alcohol dehydrogenase family)